MEALARFVDGHVAGVTRRGASSGFARSVALREKGWAHASTTGSSVYRSMASVDEVVGSERCGKPQLVPRRASGICRSVQLGCV